MYLRPCQTPMMELCKNRLTIKSRELFLQKNSSCMCHRCLNPPLLNIPLVLSFKQKYVPSNSKVKI